MNDSEAFVTISKSLEQVFNFVATDFLSNYPKWNSDTPSIELISGTTIEKGTKLAAKVSPPEIGPITLSFGTDKFEIEILEYEPNKVFSYKFTIVPSHSATIYMSFASEQGKTKLGIKHSQEFPSTMRGLSIIKQLLKLVPQTERLSQKIADDLQEALEKEELD